MYNDRKMSQPATILDKKAVIARVNRVLDTTLADYTAQATDIDPLYAEVMTELRTLVARGGKRNRPYLTYIAYAGYGGEGDAILDVAASQELYHASLLIHDDIMDQDTVRWGGPNITGVYLDRLKRLTDEPERYASSVSHVAAIVANAIANNMIAQADLSPEVRLAALQHMGDVLFMTGGGQVLDILAPVDQTLASSAPRLLALSQYKTALYTFWAPLHLGAFVAGAPEAQLTTLKECSLAAGTAFQLQDDLLGVFGNPDTTGKPVLTDMQEGKRTMLIHFGYHHGNSQQRAVLDAHWGDAHADATDLERVREALEASGARAMTEELAQQHATIAIDAMSRLDMTAPSMAALNSLIHKAVARSS